MGEDQARETIESWGDVNSVTAKWGECISFLRTLGKDDIGSGLDAASERMNDQNADIVIYANLGIFPIAVVKNPDFMGLVLKDDVTFGKPKELVSGYLHTKPSGEDINGILSMSPTDENAPYMRLPVRKGIGERFTRELNNHEHLKKRVQSNEQLIDALNSSDKPYEVVAREQKMRDFQDLFFGREVELEDMIKISEYVEGIFATVLKSPQTNVLRTIMGRTWHEMTPKKLQENQKLTEEIIFREIEKRRENPQKFDDLLGNLTSEMDTAAQKLHPDRPIHERNSDILINTLMTMFAAMDTTSSATGSLFMKISQNIELQNDLRVSANAITEILGRKFITLDELKMDKLSPELQNALAPHLAKFHRVIGTTLTEFPPTPTTARLLLKDLVLANGVVLKKGTLVFLDLGSIQSQLMDEDPNLPNSFADLLEWEIFGDGKTKCPGRVDALSSMFNTMLYMLSSTQNMTLTNPEEVTLHRGATLGHEGAKFEFEMIAA